MRKFTKKTAAILAIAAGSVVLGSKSSASASVFSWDNSGTDWGVAADWTPTGNPGAADTVSLDPDHGTGTSLNNPNLNSETQSVSILDIDNDFLGGGWSISGTSTSRLNVGSATTAGPVLNLRGVQTTTINIGSLVVNATAGTTAAATPGVIIGSDSTLDLTGNTVASVTEASGVKSDSIQLRGGTLILDNSGGNPTGQRLTSGNTNAAAISGNGANSTLVFNGAVGGTSFTGFSGGALVGNSGEFNIQLNQPASAATSVTFASLSQNNDDASFNFSSKGGTLGGGGGSPSIIFTTVPNVVNGVIWDAKSTGTANQYPFAIVTTTTGGVTSGTFATYATNGVAAAALTSENTAAFAGLGTGHATTNVNFQPDQTTTTLSGNVTVNTLTINPTGSGQTLALGTDSLITPGLILSGGNNFSITGGTLLGNPANDTAVDAVWVTNPTTILSASSSFASANDFAMYGPGILKLTGSTNQLNTTGSVLVNGGTLEVSSANLPLNQTTTPLIRLRGGVLEFDSTSGGTTFNEALGTAAKTINWGTNAGPTSNTGSGGFAAVGGPLTVNLGGASAKVTWGGQTGTDINFVQDGYSLIFGSPDSNNTVVWQNPIGLDSGTAGAYAAREINVIQGTGVAADKTQITGVISGSSSTDLIKTGTGTLQLAATNTYLGNTIVEGGTLNVTGSIVHNGSANVLVASGATAGTFGATISRSTAANASYDGIGSRIIGDLNTRADILAGANLTNNPNGETVTMQWRTRLPDETPGTQTYPPSDPASLGLISDVVRITGMANSGTTGTGITDPFALQMTYAAPTNEAFFAADGLIHIDYLDPNGAGPGTPEWQNAILGDNGTGADARTDVQESLSTFLANNTITDSNLSLYLGSWGVDTTSHTAWTIVDHNSDFAVVPEPSALSAAAIGGLALLARRRRKTVVPVR